MDGSKNAEDQVQVVADDQNVRDEGKTERVVEVDHIRVLGLNQEDEEFYLSYSPEARKKLIHKVIRSSQSRPPREALLTCGKD